MGTRAPATLSSLIRLPLPRPPLRGRERARGRTEELPPLPAEGQVERVVMSIKVTKVIRPRSGLALSSLRESVAKELAVLSLTANSPPRRGLSVTSGIAKLSPRMRGSVHRLGLVTQEPLARPSLGEIARRGTSVNLSILILESGSRCLRRLLPPLLPTVRPLFRPPLVLL